MPDVQGRVLEEALQGGPHVTEYAVLNKTHRSATKTGLTMKLPTDLDSRSTDPSLTTYAVRTAPIAATAGRDCQRAEKHQPLDVRSQDGAADPGRDPPLDCVKPTNPPLPDRSGASFFAQLLTRVAPLLPPAPGTFRG